MRSMERIVQNYGGTLRASQKEEIFSLDLLLFAPDSSAEREKTGNRN